MTAGITFSCGFACSNVTCAPLFMFERWKSEFFCGALLNFVPVIIIGAGSAGAFGAAGMVGDCEAFGMTGVTDGMDKAGDIGAGFGIFAKEAGFETSVATAVVVERTLDQPLSDSSFFDATGVAEEVSTTSGLGFFCGAKAAGAGFDTVPESGL